jgi:hypothetical protein
VVVGLNTLAMRSDLPRSSSPTVSQTFRGGAAAASLARISSAGHGTMPPSRIGQGMRPPLSRR